MVQLFAGLFTEGSTDTRFLQSIVQKTLEATAFDCVGQFDIYVSPIEIDKTNLSFENQVLRASKKGMEELGISIICVHADADNFNAIETYRNRINVAKIELNNKNETDYCKLLVAIVPIHETESWLLADKELLKQEIGTNKTDNELGIDRMPETITNPKEIISNAIRIAREGLTQRRRNDLTIGDLYLPIGQSIDLNKLEVLSSYQDFKNNVREAFLSLNLLH
jgi:Domain of unknown function (DUF4276)